MFAVVKTGGKQYKVQADDLIEIEKIEGNEGDSVILDNVLLVDDGKETKIAKDVEGYGVKAEIVQHKKDDKVIIFKKKRRQNYRRKTGHRQELTIIKVAEIGTGLDTKKATTKKAAPKKAADKKPAAKKATKAADKK